MLLPLAVAVAGFLGYKSYKKTGHIPFLKGPHQVEPEFAPPASPGFSLAADFAPEDHAQPIALPTAATRQAAIVAKPSLTERVSAGITLIQPKVKV